MIKLPTLPSLFVDPITTYPPVNEVQMSGLLGLFHQLHKLDWSKVPLLLPDNSSAGKMADELFGGAVICSEYQLFYNAESEINVGGRYARGTDLFIERQTNRRPP